jgi:galactoside O-acetyltransferase
MLTMQGLIVQILKSICGKANGVRLHLTRLWLKMQGIELGENVYIGKNVNIQLSPGGQLKIGNNVVILDHTKFVNPGAFLEIGNSTFISHHCEIASSQSIVIAENCAFAAYCTIIDTDKNYSDLLTPMPLRKGNTSPIKIENNVWLAYKVTILRGVTISEGCVVGANAVVTKNIPPYSIAVGIPATAVKCIDKGTNQQFTYSIN